MNRIQNSRLCYSYQTIFDVDYTGIFSKFMYHEYISSFGFPFFKWRFFDFGDHHDRDFSTSEIEIIYHGC